MGEKRKRLARVLSVVAVAGLTITVPSAIETKQAVGIPDAGPASHEYGIPPGPDYGPPVVTPEVVPPADDIVAVVDQNVVSEVVRSAVGDRIGLMWLNERSGGEGRLQFMVRSLTADEERRIEGSLPYGDRVDVVGGDYSMTDLAGIMSDALKALPAPQAYGLGIEMEGRGPDAQPILVMVVEAGSSPTVSSLDPRDAATLKAMVPAELLRLRVVSKGSFPVRLLVD